MWLPHLFSWRIPDSLWDGSEAAILTQCHAVVQENLSRYQPPEWPDDVLWGLGNALLRARRALMQDHAERLIN
ncbi:MAG: hypothetical protein IT210_07845 [Armatimonadetes bacterium]|nr:hypothetical protein [Armatimonadota bacterium]